MLIEKEASKILEQSSNASDVSHQEIQAVRNKMCLGHSLVNVDFKQAANLSKDTSFQWFFNKKTRAGGTFDPQTGIGTLRIKKVKTTKQLKGFGDHMKMQKIHIPCVVWAALHERNGANAEKSTEE